MRYLVTLLLFLTGCVDNEQMERYRECLSICNATGNVCNDFSEEDCISHCSSLTSMEEVEDFHVCADCYVAVYCDTGMYGYVCYPSCDGGL